MGDLASSGQVVQWRRVTDAKLAECSASKAYGRGVFSGPGGGRRPHRRGHAWPAEAADPRGATCTPLFGTARKVAEAGSVGSCREPARCECSASLKWVCKAWHVDELAAHAASTSAAACSVGGKGHLHGLCAQHPPAAPMAGMILQWWLGAATTFAQPRHQHGPFPLFRLQLEPLACDQLVT